jgi:hypothetical protein
LIKKLSSQYANLVVAATLNSFSLIGDLLKIPLGI